MPKVSQNDIAKRLGISQRAVSKALKGAGVSSATREKVEAMARKLGYRSNRLARSLIDGETKIIGALTPGLSGLFLAQLFDAANYTLAERGYHLLTSRWHSQNQTDENEINVLLQYSVEGIITIPRSTMPWEKTIYAELAKRGEKIVFANQKFPGDGICSVYSDDFRGSMDAMEYLVENGHRDILFLEPGDNLGTSRILRRQGYEQALLAAGIPVNPDYICNMGKQNVTDWLPATIKKYSQVTAAFCFNDGTALEVIDILADIGLKVPEDISVIGYGNDIPYPEQMKIPLTTVNQSPAQIGITAAQQLLKKLADESTENEVIVPTELIIRKSVKGVNQ